MAQIRKILVANRGEIACRVMHTAQAQGIGCVAVYSDPDATAPHVAMADEAVLIGPGPVGRSYLVAENIIAAARETGADAIHPGYGFLSENADFAKAVEAAGLIFIGPTAEAIELMGNKAAAKRRMIEAGVPCVPGYEGEDQSDTALMEEAGKIGFPLMVKAAAGGGGRGMRLVESPDGLAAALSTARSEAENAFGSGELILEKAIVEPRHVEIQVFADMHGQVIHLGERDCSVQRRHQKVIEEAPCPVMSEDLRAAMGKAAVDAAQSINYRGAGTVEFLLDKDGDFYFLEMNTRLQVEHPVTEEVTGLDLVALQIRVAEGAPLGLTQADVTLTGHALEVRLYAEDPYNQFLPSTGKIEAFGQATGVGVRYDTGIVAGQEISPFYDPMIAKLITYGDSRETALKRMIAALKETVLFGPRTNRDFLIACLEDEAFAAGDFSTAFIAETFGEDGMQQTAPDAADLAVIALRHFLADRHLAESRSLGVPVALRNFTSDPCLKTGYKLEIGDMVYPVQLRAHSANHYTAHINDTQIELVSRGDETMTRLAVLVDGKAVVSQAVPSGDSLHVMLDGRGLTSTNLLARGAAADESGDGTRVLAPLHGKIVEIFVEAGASVTRGDRLAIVEAMKMQHEILAEIDGTIDAILVAAEQQVAADDLMISIAAQAAGEG